MAWTDVTPIIPNTTMQLYTNSNGVDTTYKIVVVDGYALHDKNRDRTIYDNEGNIVSITLGFTGAGATCPISYDFTENPREFYTVLIEELPENAVIFGAGNNNHEIM